MKNGRRTIVMAHVDLKAGRIEFLVKKQRIQPGRRQLPEFMSFSSEECRTIGMDSIEYCLNCYDDDVAYIWPTYFAHIASIRQPEETLKQILINELSCRVEIELTRTLETLCFCDLREQLIGKNRDVFEQVEEPENHEVDFFKGVRYESVYLFMLPQEAKMQLCRMDHPYLPANRDMVQLRFDDRSLPKVRSMVPDNRTSPEVHFISSVSLHGQPLISYLFDEILADNGRRQTKYQDQYQWLRQIYHAIRTNCQ